jgi:hypothetical protein
MAALAPSPAGPLFGPDFVLVTVNDDDGTKYSIEVYPDAMNNELRAAGLPAQYYWQPGRVYLAKKQDSPQDYSFGMTVFKGLMTTETTVGITDEMTTGGTVESGGGFCAFTTTFAIPDSVIEKALELLKAGEHSAPVSRLQHLFFNFSEGPAPLLGIVPILENEVTIEVPDLIAATSGNKVPMFISAQGTGKGSIEAHGNSSFLVTCNQLAAGAIAGALKEGKSPFTVHCNLKEQVYIHGCQVEVVVDVDKTYDQFSAALSVGGFLGIDNASLEYTYRNMLTSGAITTHITMDDGNLTPELKQWIEKNVDDMRKAAFDLVKTEIFDWHPADMPPASAQRGLFSSIFGGASVSLKASHEKRAVKLSQKLTLDTTIAVYNTISGTLEDLLPAVTADLDKYLSVIDIGEFFKKIQVAAACAINFGETLPDGSVLRDPITSCQLEVSYPDFSSPGNAEDPNLVTQAQGFHYTVGHKDPNGPGQLAQWSKENPNDIVNISFLRLDKDLDFWPADQLKLRKTLVYDGSDPRVDLKDGRTQVEIEQVGAVHAPKLSAEEVGYVYARIMLDRPLPKENVSVTLTCKIGDRTDTLTMTKANQKNLLWEVYSDKYFDVEQISYTVEVTVSGPNFTDDPVVWSSSPVTVKVPKGRIKYISPLKVALPPVPADKKEIVNTFITQAPA